MVDGAKIQNHQAGNYVRKLLAKLEQTRRSPNFFNGTIKGLQREDAMHRSLAAAALIISLSSSAFAQGIQPSDPSAAKPMMRAHQANRHPSKHPKHAPPAAPMASPTDAPK
jgi:hypothetical protein